MEISLTHSPPGHALTGITGARVATVSDVTSGICCCRQQAPKCRLTASLSVRCPCGLVSWSVLNTPPPF